MIKGKIHSIQTMGTLDGPGVRFVAFMQGCNLRCKCCHNPDTWEMNTGEEYSAQELVSKVLRYIEYFGKEGGVTLSGGEPLLQPEFVFEYFRECHKHNINTCLDTSGSVINEKTEKLLDETDRVLLDIKYTDDKLYFDNVGCTMEKPIKFLELCQEKRITVTLRQVIIPTINDNEQNIKKLKEIAEKYPCVEKIELLPFKKICQTKYDAMNIEFPFANLPTPDAKTMEMLNDLL
jgi:pyruvate formate lyase activating enzyme